MYLQKDDSFFWYNYLYKLSKWNLLFLSNRDYCFLEKISIRIANNIILSSFTYMIYVLLTLFHLIFIIFFVNIGARYMSVVPVWFILVFILNNTTDLWHYDDIHSLVEHDIYYVSRSIVIITLYVLLNTMWLNPIYNWLALILLNIVLYVWAIVYQYKEGITIFHLWRYVTRIIYVGHLSILFGPMAGWMVCCLLCVFYFAVYGFIQFIVWSFAPIPKIHGYMTFLYAQSSILIMLGVVRSQNILINLIAWQLYLMGNYWLIYTILRYYHYYEQYHKADLKYILAGNKLFDIPSVLHSQYLNQVYHFFDKLTPTIKYMFGWLNIVLIAVIIVVFTWQYNQVSTFSTVVYWIALWLFFGNYTLLKQIHYQSKFERAGIFLILNIGALLGIGAMFDDIILQVMFAIIRNLLSSAAIFHVKQQYSDLLLVQDYRYRLRANTASLCFVVWRMIMLPINPNIIFSLSLFYVCLYIFVWLQTYKFLKQYDKIN